MPNELIQTILSEDDTIRNRPIDLLLRNKDMDQLKMLSEELEEFRKSSNNLYHKVRASLFLFVIFRYFLQSIKEVPWTGEIPFKGIKSALDRNFEQAVSIYRKNGDHNSALYSALADSYYHLSFQYLLDQVKLAISRSDENYNLYNIAGLDDYPFSAPPELTAPDPETGLYPLGVDASPVRLDPSHSGWSDIFFLGMDFPEGAKVVNISVNLRIHGSAERILPPCECYSRFIEEPVIRLTSVDLNASKRISTLKELFNFGNDYLSLLKAGVVASGIVPPCFERKDISLEKLLHRLLGRHGGIEVLTKVNNIPKGSRLAVSTTLLATVITRLMRFSGQIQEQTGGITEEQRRTAASRAILGEWLGGSGGGWQDSGGLWPGIKLITGRRAENGDSEFGVSRGCLLPEHKVFSREEISEDTEKKILDSMVLVHGGISQDVGPILEMVTEKYLLKYEKEWNARLKGIQLFDKIVNVLKAGDMKELGRLTTEDWEEAIQKVIPWVNNAFTEELINRAKEYFKDDYWGFLMLGGMSGGGMAFIVNPKIKTIFKNKIAEIMSELKQKYNSSLPFIIDPAVYDFEINHEGISAKLLKGKEAIMPSSGTASEPVPAIMSHDILNEEEINKKYGFDAGSHEYMKTLLKKGEIGLAKNRLHPGTKVEDVLFDEIYHFEDEDDPSFLLPLDKGRTGGVKEHGSDFYETGINALRNNEIAVVTFAGGMGSRWTHGSAVVKPINPFIRIDGKYRSFIEIHIAKSRKSGMLSGHYIPHIFTTSYLTHDAISEYMTNCRYFDYEGRIYLSPARSIGRRVYPMERDLRFYWQEQLQQKMDENVQKVQDAAHGSLIEWAKSRGEGEDYSENNPILRFNPPGHWHEIPNLIKNGVLAKILKHNPALKYIFCHNVDTMGAHIDPVMLGIHIAAGPCITFEVTPRRIEDSGGGLAKINGRKRLIEGLALPREEDEFKLSYYNTNTNWITIDSLLDFFGLNRGMLSGEDQNHLPRGKIIEAINRIEKLMPAYVTIKEVKRVWGSGQEDVYPVAQFEKLWGDMTAFEELKVNYVSVSRFRGQQLKEPSLLDAWVTDGSLDYMKSKCVFN